MQTWRSLSRFHKVLIVLIAVWLLAMPFVAGRFADPQLLLSAPFLLVFVLIGGLALVGWVARKFGH